jgi:hypothetical protein
LQNGDAFEKNQDYYKGDMVAMTIFNTIKFFISG